MRWWQARLHVGCAQGLTLHPLPLRWSWLQHETIRELSGSLKDRLTAGETEQLAAQQVASCSCRS